MDLLKLATAVVERFNNDAYGACQTEKEEENLPLMQIVYNGWAFSIVMCDRCVWCSENSPSDSYLLNDEEDFETLYNYVRDEVVLIRNLLMRITGLDHAVYESLASGKES
ncbi:hypothetical protein LU11_gp030 [Pseudomonas phage Lu11]|uniref:hypothetical protein n=1 Tax=Pseudomonas phage Lu11 TaxID=1161927 RepID=UPI00025F14F8|nr:hypothetical protein LU11_gp030 [Pseudomonas phage Lu11]AFH14561.1 hypothetical protein Lu11_0030 [Pseudomonas phage Lu11]